MQNDDLGKKQSEAALQQLREIEKARLKLEGEDRAIPHFTDMMVHAVWLISDLAADAIRRGEAAKREGKG
jgi:hypothetical protein